MEVKDAIKELVRTGDIDVSLIDTDNDSELATIIREMEANNELPASGNEPEQKLVTETYKLATNRDPSNEVQ